MSLKLYYDLLSQPSRALLIFLQKTKIPFEKCPVALRNGEHLSEEYKQIHRFNKVPAIDDKGFKLIESIGIVRYLAREHKIDDHWYPKDSKQQARVDEYLEWQHHNTRAFCALYFQAKWLNPILTGKPTRKEKLESTEKKMIECLDVIESEWLGNNPWMVGNKISVADIFAACEIEQVRMCGYDPKVGRSKISEWLGRVRNDTNPFYDEAHKVLNKVADQAMAAAKP